MASDSEHGDRTELTWRTYLTTGSLPSDVKGHWFESKARIASRAAAGQLLISDHTVQAAGIQDHGMECRELELKGKTTPVKVWVWKV